ncbi:MAG: hypothetical protein JXR07_01885 [Reichenbachiella sp.]
MKSKYQNGEQFYHKLYISFNGFIAVTLLPMGWLLLEKQTDQLVPLPIDAFYTWLIITSIFLATSALIYSSLTKFKKATRQAAENKRLRIKLDAYRRASTTKYFEFLLVGILYFVGMWLTGNTLFLVGYIVSLILLSLGRPTISAFIEDLKLSAEEETILLEKKPIE